MLSYENLTSGFVSSLRESASHSPANGLFPRFRKAEDPRIWRDHAVNVTGKALPAGHFLPEEVPDETLSELHSFLQG